MSEEFLLTGPINHFYLREPNGLLGVVAYQTRSDGFVGFAVSTRNPRDNFDKQKGVDIALARLRKGICKIIPIETFIKNDILRNIANDGGYSMRTRASAKTWLEFKASMENADVCP